MGKKNLKSKNKSIKKPKLKPIRKIEIITVSSAPSRKIKNTQKKQNTKISSVLLKTNSEKIGKAAALPKPASLKIEQQLTLKNHFEFGFDGTPFIFRTSNEQRWWVNYGRCSRLPLDWRSECIIAAHGIRESTQRELWLCFSGGIDSEVVAESFRYARVPFRAAIMRFKNDMNIQDICWAIAYCEIHNVPYELFDLDIDEFFNSGEMMHFADLTQCPTPQLPSSMKLMDIIAKRGGYPILGSAECYLSRHKTGWYMYEREKIASLYRFLLKTGHSGQAGFFQWSPEIMFSFLVDPIVKNLVNDKIPTHKDTYYLKPEIYAQYFKLQPRPKYTGFEKVARLDRKWRPILAQKYGHCDEQVYIRYDELIRQLAYEKPASEAANTTANPTSQAVDNTPALSKTETMRLA